MSDLPGTREGSRATVLRVLAAHPEGLRAARIAELADTGMDGLSRQRLSDTLTHLQARGYARRVGPNKVAEWFITEAGTAKLAAGTFRAANGTFTHGTNHGYQRGCRCDACRAWGHDYRLRNPGAAKKRNAESRDVATHHGEHWTGPELETASRGDLTTAEVARMLGRTLRSVQGKRQALRK